MKKPVKILLIVLAVFVALSVVKNAVAQSVLTSALSRAAHVPVRVGGVSLSFISASIRIKNVQVHNPSGFSDKTMVDVPQVYIDFEPGELLKGRAQFKEVRLEL